MNTKIFDTHAHYDDERFEDDRETLLTEMFQGPICNVVNVGANLASSRNSIELSKQYEPVYAAVGVHPEDAGEIDDESLKWLEQVSFEKKVVAIGEIGLDYYYMDHDKKTQADAFQKQLHLARKVNLPIIVHSRDACEDTLNIIKESDASTPFDPNYIPGVIHCFSYSAEIALTYVKMGYFIGVGGVVTFANSKKLKEVVTSVPLSHIVLETDCPYLSPVPNRGKRNSSLNLPYVVEEISRLTGITPEEVIQTTTQNARKLYRL